MSKQLTHNSSPFSEKKFPIVVLAENLKSPANIGSLFRLADAFQIEKLILFGKNIDLSSNRLRRTARSTVNFVEHEISENLQKTIQHYVAQNYKLYCLEITDKSIPLENIKINKDDKLLIILGEENFGVNSTILTQADATVHINMFGKNSSMNVAQACGIALYEITKKLLAFQKK